MRKTALRLALVMLLALFAVGTLVAGGTNEGPKKKYSFYLFSVGFWHPYLIAHIHGAQEAASKYPIDLVVVDGRNDSGFQANQVIQSLAKKPDAILIAPVTEQGAVPALREAKKAGIPVFTTDRNVADPSLRLAYVGSSQAAIGKQAGQYAVDWLQKSGLPKPWKVGILQGLMGNIGNTERTGGWLEIINPLVNSGDIKIVADIAGDWSRETTVTKMQELLVKTHDFNVLMCSNDAEAAGASIAMDAAGLKA
jgi:ABC-type sugar transport system substrate-binding protein